VLQRPIPHQLQLRPDQSHKLPPRIHYVLASSLSPVPLLNEASPLFRRKYYENGSHAGFILYLTDPAQNEAELS
jgi:hypothetical protein